MQLLKHKKAIVTGGTRGIGRGIAEEFVRQGADLVIFGTDETRCQIAVDDFKLLSIFPEQTIDYKVVNVADHEAVQKAMEETIHYFSDTLDILVNCAGITKDKLLMRMSEEDWDQVLDVNLKSIYNTCLPAIKPMMKARKGKIINISSVIGLTGNAGQVNYSASKFGMVGFTRSLAIELGKRGICVNAIAPGFIDTDMTAKLADAQKQELLKGIPMQRLGLPSDIAQAAVFLASSMSDYITGQTLVVDGGMLA